MTHFLAWILPMASFGWLLGEVHAEGPKISCAEPIFDFGAVEAGGVVSHIFTVTNTGDRELTVKKLHTPCGCTTAEMKDRVIPPGGSAEIAARLNLGGRKGFLQKSVYVETNDPEKRNFTLTFQGSVGVVLEVEPPYMVVRRSSGTDAAAGSVAVRDPLGTPFKILKATSTAGNLKLEPVQENEGWVLRAMLAKELIPGQHGDKILIETDHPLKKQLQIDALIIVSADIVVAPQTLILPAESGSGLTRTLIIRGKDVQGLSIDSVETPVAGMTHKIEPMGGSGFRITIGNIRPDAAMEGKRIRIRTGGSEPRLLDVPISLKSETDER